VAVDAPASRGGAAYPQESAPGPDADVSPADLP